MDEQKEVTVDRWSFVVDAFPYSAQAYDDARAIYIEKLVDDLSPLAVYEYGRVGVVGISDIDLLVILDPEQSIRRAREPQLDAVGRYLIDKPILLSPDAFRNLRKLIYIDPLENRYGQASPPVDIPEGHTRILSAALFVDFSHILLHRFNKMHFVRRLSLRNTLLRLNSLHHSARLAELCGANVGEEVVSLLAQIRDLRSHWFSRPRYDIVACLLHQAVPALIHLFDAVSQVANDQGWCGFEEPWNEPPMLQIAPTSFSVFSSAFVDFDDPENRVGVRGPSFSIGGSNYNFTGSVAALPPFAYLHLEACANGSGVISRLIRRKLGAPRGGDRVSELYQSVILERMAIGAKHWEFLDRLCLSGFGQFPTYGMPQEFLRPSDPKAALTTHLPSQIVAGVSRVLARRSLRQAAARLDEIR
jgi:hypothetical protein